MSSPFAARTSVEAVEEGMLLAPKFNANGVIPVIITDAVTGEVLMHAYMNEVALLKNLETVYEGKYRIPMRAISLTDSL